MLFWQLAFNNRGQKQFEKLPKNIQKRIFDYFDERVLNQPNPFILASRLVNDEYEFFRYRIGDYRIITQIDQGKMIILAVEVGHRKEIYKKTRH